MCWPSSRGPLGTGYQHQRASCCFNILTHAHAQQRQGQNYINENRTHTLHTHTHTHTYTHTHTHRITVDCWVGGCVCQKKGPLGPPPPGLGAHNRFVLTGPLHGLMNPTLIYVTQGDDDVSQYGE